jgi:ABC-type Na+ efflux pump permease subunit
MIHAGTLMHGQWARYIGLVKGLCNAMTSFLLASVMVYVLAVLASRIAGANKMFQKACTALALVAAVAAFLSVVGNIVPFLAFGAYLAAFLSGVGALFIARIILCTSSTLMRAH